MFRALWRWALLGFLSLAMFLLFPGAKDFVTSHEARIAQPAREMAASGWPWAAQPVPVAPVHPMHTPQGLRLAPDLNAPPIRVNPWVIPILNQQIRLAKPPLPYWCAAILFRVPYFGASEAAARLVPALLGVLATLILYDLATLLYGRHVAWCAALIWLTTYLVPDEYRLAMADPYLAFFTLAALWAWVRASRATEGPSPRRGAAYLLLFYLALALGALSKGPLILLAVVPIALFHFCFRARSFGSWKAHVAGIVLLIVVALPWPLLVLRQVPNAGQIWWYESFGEITGQNRENVETWSYYLRNLPLLAAPWVAVWIWSLIYPLRRIRRKRLFGILWYAITILFFSAVGQKKLPYLLPMMPASPLMLAVAAVPLLRLTRRKKMRGTGGLIVVIQIIIGIGWAAALPYFVWQARERLAPALALSALAIVAAVLVIREVRTARPMRWLAAQAAAYAAIALVFGHCYWAPHENCRSPREVCAAVRQLAAQRGCEILMSTIPEEAAFYLPLNPPRAAAADCYIAILDDQEGVRARARSRPTPPLDFRGWVPGAITVSAQRIPIDSAPGDARWKVFELRVARAARP